MCTIEYEGREEWLRRGRARENEEQLSSTALATSCMRRALNISFCVCLQVVLTRSVWDMCKGLSLGHPGEMRVY